MMELRSTGNPDTSNPDEIMGLRKGTVYRRIHENGWSVERAIITPIISKYSHVEGEK